MNDGKDLPQEVEHDKFISYSISSAALGYIWHCFFRVGIAKNALWLLPTKLVGSLLRMVKKLAKIDTANLINIITNSKIIPEHLFEECTANKITSSLRSLLENDSNQITAMTETMNQLGINKKDKHLLAAKSVLKNI